MPSRGWFYGYAKYVEAQPDQGERLITERLGKGVWEQFHLVFDTFVHRAQFPLQYVFADHWLLDAWIVDEETRTKPSRLWLTLLIDAYSRSILGMALLYEDPCIESIQQALRHAIWEKTLTWISASRKSGTAAVFPYNWCSTMPGRITHTVWKISHASSHAMESTTPSTWCFARPTRDATVRSLSGSSKTFRARSRSWPPGPLPPPIRKAYRTAAHNACLLYPDMNRLLHQLILNYQHTPHRELGGMTPHQRWSEGIQSSGFPLVPPFTPAMDRLFLRMYPQPRQVSSKGIPAFGLHYWSASLAGYRTHRPHRARYPVPFPLRPCRYQPHFPVSQWRMGRGWLCARTPTGRWNSYATSALRNGRWPASNVGSCEPGRQGKDTC